MRSYEQEQAFMEGVAGRLRSNGRKATVEDTGGSIQCVIVEHAGEGPSRALWVCGTASETWGGTLEDEATGDHLERDFDTEVPSDSEDADAVAAALLHAIALEEATPDAPEEYVARAARWIGENARAIAEHGTPGATMDQFLEAARLRIARAFEDGYKAALAETGLADRE